MIITYEIDARLKGTDKFYHFINYIFLSKQEADQFAVWCKGNNIPTRFSKLHNSHDLSEDRYTSIMDLQSAIDSVTYLSNMKFNKIRDLK